MPSEVTKTHRPPSAGSGRLHKAMMPLRKMMHRPPRHP
jgi:hypothetical protein